MRPEVPGTVAVGALAEDDHFHRGIVGGAPARVLPQRLQLDRKLVQRGRERFNIHCAVCHDRVGTGDSLVVKKGMIPPPKYADPRLRAMPIGKLFITITEGVRNMASYAAQVPAEDRWAIVAYVRALQISQSASLGDVPQDVVESKGWGK
jgi:mono/diheme cytochrome c family protein